MGVHKLTAGDGYTYLTRQVAVHDATDRGHQGLADYYAEKGESPGRWFGAGIGELGLEAGSEVTEAQMRNLFGEGRHPEAEKLEAAALDAGGSVAQAKKTSQLGRVFAIYRGNQPEFIQESAKRYVAYNLQHGVHWKTPVPADVRARIRTDLGDGLFRRAHGRAPLDERERGSFLAQASRQQTTAVAGYDLTFTPVKSVSTLWALADRDVARQIEDAHHSAVEATLRWLEKQALFTRRGRGGIQQVKAIGLIAGLFTHRDARSSDPHLHTHVAVSNKVQDLHGRWLAIDGRVLYKANVTCSETYNTLLEAELIARLGVRFHDRRRDREFHGAAESKRQVREVVGVDERLAAAWSKRHRAIEVRRRDLAADFQAAHGRPPTEGEAVTLAEKAWDQTRQAKHEPRTEAEQRTTWSTEAAAVLGGRQAIRDMVEHCLGHSVRVQAVTDDWVSETARTVVERVADDRATWQVWHLRAEAQRQVRSHGVALAELDTAVDRVVSVAIADHCVAFTDPDPLTCATTAADRGLTIPAPLQRTDRDDQRGRGGVEVVSVYSLAGARQYTSQAVIDAEQRILNAARCTGKRSISDVRVGIAIAETAAAGDSTGFHLNAAQQSLVREMATSGRAVQLALAPAGTGKTAAMRVLAQAWQDSGGTVIGLAPSAVAAQELGASINPISTREDDAKDAHHLRPFPQPWRVGRGLTRNDVRADTLAKLVWHAQHPNESGGAPAWMERIGHNTLVVIDEAGMAATTDLAAAIDFVTARGAQVRLVGDDRQLASVSAGGVLRDIAHQIGAVTLSEVHRFLNRDGTLNHAEAAATLALRNGDPSAIAFYADRGRIHVGDLGACADQAYAAWVADRADGIDSMLVAPTRELVAELNMRARHDRLDGQDKQQVGGVLPLADGTYVSSGDRIITRANDRHLPVTRTDWVKNGDRWHVKRVNADGSLRVTHDQLHKTTTLPADYVATSVQLGYATTVHGAQGITTGTCHVVLTGDEDRNLLYVALSRGRYANHLYLNVSSDGDTHNLIRPEALIPPTALQLITDMLRRDGSPVSATTTKRDHSDPRQVLGDLAARYHDALATGAEHLIGTTGLKTIDDHAEALLAGLTDALAWPTLRSHLALLALDEHNPLHLLTSALTLGSLADARDPAAVLDARVDGLTADLSTTLTTDLTTARLHDTGAPPSAAGPLSWLPGIPTRLADNIDWGPFLTAYHQRVREQAAAVREIARRWTSATAPAWAQPLLDDPDPAAGINADADLMSNLRSDLAVWRAVAEVAEADLRPTGERTIGAPGAHQSKLNRAVRRARPSYPFSQRAWYRALPESVRADPWITPLCQRLARLERAGLPVADYITQALNSDPASDRTTTGTQGQPHTPDRADPDTGWQEETSGPRPPRPLPDEHQAAALWWRLVPHLGPAALEADEHSANLLQPSWRTTLAELVGDARADYLQQTPAWPALVAAVDEANEHHDWSQRDILTSALTGVPQDGSLTGAEVADALVLRIALLTDQPAEPPGSPSLDSYIGAAGPDPIHNHVEPAHPGLMRAKDADGFMAACYCDLVHDDLAASHAPAAEEVADLHAAIAAQDSVDVQPAYGYNGTVLREPAADPYIPPPPWQDDSEHKDVVTSEYAFPDPGEIPPERIVGLNQQAMAYFEECYPRSWAPDYLRDRFGTDPTRSSAYGARFAVGYAPGGGRSLLRHLTAQGATLDELGQAGLLSRRERSDGTTYYIDFFRDRLIMPIRDPHDPAGQAILGFIGRRNPSDANGDHTRTYIGPKYLNTRTTCVFAKGATLFGYAEARELLAADALPVIVEGPMDALAITLGGGGAAVGVAPMGTTLTVDQIKLLRAHIDLVNGRDRIAVATDSDAAGWRSAQKNFWNLTAADLDPAHLVLPPGMDPANLLETHGPGAIAAIIRDQIPLGDAMTDHLLNTSGPWSDTAVRQALIQHASRILGARGAEHWPDAFERLRNRLHLAPGILEHRTITESIEYDLDRASYAQARINEINDHTQARIAEPARTAWLPGPKNTLAETATHTQAEQHKPAPAASEPMGPSR
jgi:DNA primase catalytic core